MIIFFSDIKWNDSRSSFSLVKPLIDYLHKFNGKILCPNSSEFQSINVINFYMPFYKNKNFILRSVSEIVMPISALYALFKIKKKNYSKIEKLISYSPSIFTVFFLIFFKLLINKNIKSYLILRDIFPDWAISSRVIKNKYIIYFLKKIAQLQFSHFDQIGLQDSTSLEYIRNNYFIKSKLEILPNWFNDNALLLTENFISKKIKQEFSSNHFHLTYTGSIGYAQNAEIIIDALIDNSGTNINNLKLHIFGEGFLYLKIKKKYIKKNNIIFWDKVDQNVCNLALSLSSAAWFSLDTNLKTNNIPGKYLNYIRFSLPVFAVINQQNKLMIEINENNIGIAISTNNIIEIKAAFEIFFKKVNEKNFFNSRVLFDNKYSFENASKNLKVWLMN